VASLWNWEMGNFLNLVYDDVEVTQDSIITYMESYLGISDYKIFHINHIPDDDEKYYYFFEYRHYLSPYIKIGEKLPLNELVISLLKDKKNFNLILQNNAESDDGILIERLDILFTDIGIDTSKIVVINCNERNFDLKHKLGSNIRTHTTNNGKFVYSMELIRFPYEYKEKRDFLFMCYNRSVKIHRFALLVYLIKHNIIDSVDWSWIRGYEVRDHFIPKDTILSESWFLKTFFNNQELKEFEKEINNLSDINMKKSVYELTYQVDYPPYKFDTEASYSNNPYSNSYINVVTETNFEKDNIIILSEKSFIPFYFSQIPIIMASTNHIKKMKDLHGLDFFDDIVNHDYDSEPNLKKRFQMIVNEIIRLNSKKEDIANFFKHNKERFDNNRKIIEELIKDKKDYNFYNSLR